MSIIEDLKACQDKKYQAFQSKLVPNIDPKTILGVRTPEMRAIAKKYSGTSDAEKFLKKLPHKYYEENLVHIFLVSMFKDFDECVKEVEKFLPLSIAGRYVIRVRLSPLRRITRNCSL